MDKLEKAARLYAGITPDVKDALNLYKLKTNHAEKALKKYNAFKAGAEWQMNNMWISINDKNKEMPNNEDMFIKMENGEVRRYNEDWEEEFMLDGIVTHWMPIPKLVK